MADRADYLARTLIARLNNLAARLAEDRRGEPDRQQRIATIEKVLVVELGITDTSTLAAIEAAVPHGKTDQAMRDQDVTAFAEFLRQRLAAEFAQS